MLLTQAGSVLPGQDVPRPLLQRPARLILAPGPRQSAMALPGEVGIAQLKTESPPAFPKHYRIPRAPLAFPHTKALCSPAAQPVSSF